MEVIEILLLVGFFVYLIVSSIVEIIKEDKEKARRPKKIIDYDHSASYNSQIRANTNKNNELSKKKKMMSVDDPALTDADINYRKKVNKKIERNLTGDRFVVMCPNCGAPLETIYTECKYCGLSYREAMVLSESFDDKEDKDA